MRRGAARAAGAAAAALLGLAPVAAGADVLGRKPAYTNRALSDVPNAEAITVRIWAPGLNEGFVPQGLTFAAGAIYVSAYKSEDRGQDRGPCRLYRVDPRSGAVWGTLDLPPSCGHAGGIARGRPGRLWVADTREVFEIGLSSGDGVIGTVLGSVRLAGALKGSFAAGSPDALWLGTYSNDPGARLYKMPFDRLGQGSDPLSEANATASIVLPTKAQGAAFDAAGRLWVTRSGADLGELLQIDTTTGAVLQRFTLPAGLEDISFEPGGALWALSEAGSKRWLNWPTFFPVVFRLEMGKLR
jgi:sugar lactone lactonase YvrE